MHSLADRTESKVNETVTWRVTVSGQGNIDKLTDPEWPELTGWRAFDSEASISTQIVDDKFGGTRTTDLILVPTEAGILSLPPVEFSYFNPEIDDYVTVSSNPIEVKVGPDASASGSSGGIQPDPTLPSAVEQQITLSDSPLEIRPNKPAESKWAVGSPLVTDRSGYWLLFTVPLALVGGHFVWQMRKQHRLANVDVRRSQQAKKTARRLLRAIKKDDPKKYEITGRILSEYISTRLNRSIVGVTQSQVSDLLVAHGIEPGLADKVLRVLDICDMGRYSPHSGEIEDEDIVKVVEKLIDELDKSFNQQ